jgi:mannose-6-phosphate isomerase-like protein (cupin superfamily)
MSYVVQKAIDRQFTADRDVPGFETAQLVGAASGSVHIQYDICRLAPGASAPAMRHIFEESWFVLEGSGAAYSAAAGYAIEAGSFGYTPIGVPEQKVAGPDGLVWIRMRAPQPRADDPRHGDRDPIDWIRSATLRAPDEGDVVAPGAGQFRESDMGAPGPLVHQGVGYHGPNIKSVYVRMLLEPTRGVDQHTMFIVEAGPSGAQDPDARFATEHYHAFEEIYYLLKGSWRGLIDGEPVEMSAGDLAWTGVNATHGFVVVGDEPCRWLEVQAPQPPRKDAFFFPKDWE